MLSAALAGIGARLICHPLDTIKTVAFTGFAGEHHRQPLSANSATGSRLAFVEAARTVAQRDGIKGFYRGVGVACVGSAPGVALYLTTYDTVSDWWTALGGSLDARVSLAEEQRTTRIPLLSRLAASTPTFVTSFCSGLVAEAVSCLIWVPIDVSKERLQSQPPSLQGRYGNSLDALRTIVRNEGITGLYKGYWSTLGSFGPFSATYFVCYEFFTRRLRTAAFTEGTARDNFMVALISGAGGNVVASLVTNPLELIKTRLQVQRAVLNSPRVGGVSQPRSLFQYHYSGLVDGMKTVTKEEGVRALWRGVGCRMAYTAPNAALTMAFYEAFKPYFV